MLCDCSCDIENENALEVEREVTARKPWSCCECGEDIKPGERYQRFTLLRDGGWISKRTCIPCARIRSSLCDCWIFGELRERIWECLGFDYLTGEEAEA